jgi:signal transduction histidine kinase
VLADETTKTSLSINDFQWEYKVGDSPTDEVGIPLWTKDDDSSSSWTSCNNPQKGIKNIGDNYLWLRTTLPLKKLKDASIFLLTYDKAWEVYLEGELLHQFGDFKTVTDKFSPGSLWELIDLPENYSGKTIYLRMFSYNKYNTGILSRFEVGPGSTFAEKILKQDIDTVFLVGLFIFVGLCSIVISNLGKVRTHQKSFLFLGMFSIFIGLWLISMVNIKQYFLSSASYWMYHSHFTLLLLPFWFCLFLKSILNRKYTPLLSKIIICSLAYTLVSAAGTAFRIFALPSTMSYFHVSLVFIIVIITFMTVKSLFNGSTIERTFGISFVLLYIFIVIDIIRWYYITTYNFKFLTQWAMFIFVLTMAFSLVLELVDSQNKLKLYSEEIRLKEEILEEKKKLLSEMSNYDKMKTEFFINISHELRTPLNIILSTLQLINLYIDKGQIFSGQVDFSRHLKVMKQNCYRLLRLVNNIIDISKIDSGYMEPAFHKHDIVAAVEGTTMSVVDYIKSKGIELYFDTDTEEKYICFDQEKIERVMLNLLSNAVKFSKPGSTIAVELQDKYDSVSISVKDTGIGIQPDTLQDIFERFVQVDKSLTRSQEGSGIGLSLVKSLVEIHKGTISVESEYGKGSTFTFILPATLPETIIQGSEKQNIPPAPVEKVCIEFSDIYN